MKIPSVSRGGFFGIFIPGAFLLANIVFFFPKQWLFESTFNSLTGNTSDSINLYNVLDSLGLGFIFFILAFVFGVAIRTISVEYLDNTFPYFHHFFYCKNNKSSKRGFILRFLKWISKRNLDKLTYPKSYTNFYSKYVHDEFDFDPSAMTWREFLNNKLNSKSQKALINYFKTYVFGNSELLRAEILYLEGISRLACGMCYALIASVYIINFSNFVNFEIASSILAGLYIFIFLIFYSKIDIVRGKEVNATLEAFAMLKNKSYLKYDTRQRKILDFISF